MIAARRVLVVEGEPGMRAELVAALAGGRFAVEAVPTGEDGLARLQRGGIDLVIAEFRLPGIGGLALIRAMRSGGMELPAVIITAHGTIDDAVAAMKLGACDFLTKPFSSTDVVSLARWALAVADRPYAARHVLPGERRVPPVGHVASARGPAALESTVVGREHPDQPVPQLGGGLAGLTVREMERQLILQTLARTGNNRTHAARMLGISIRTLRNKLAAYRVRGELEPAGAETSRAKPAWPGEPE